MKSTSFTLKTGSVGALLLVAILATPVIGVEDSYAQHVTASETWTMPIASRTQTFEAEVAQSFTDTTSFPPKHYNANKKIHFSNYMYLYGPCSDKFSYYVDFAAMVNGPIIDDPGTYNKLISGLATCYVKSNTGEFTGHHAAGGAILPGGEGGGVSLADALANCASYCNTSAGYYPGFRKNSVQNTALNRGGIAEDNGGFLFSGGSGEPNAPEVNASTLASGAIILTSPNPYSSYKHAPDHMCPAPVV